MDFKSLSEKTAYLRGLIKGLKSDDEVIALIAEILNDMAHQLEETRSDMGELAELVDNIDEDLGEMEGDFYESEESVKDTPAAADSSDNSFDEPASADTDDNDDDDDDFVEEEWYEVTCPTCNKTISLNGAMIEEGTITCPNCGELLEFDIDDEEDSGRETKHQSASEEE